MSPTEREFSNRSLVEKTSLEDQMGFTHRCAGHRQLKTKAPNASRGWVIVRPDRSRTEPL